jgi:hypothetical protein
MIEHRGDVALGVVDVGDGTRPAHYFPGGVTLSDEVECEPAHLAAHHDAKIAAELRLAAGKMGSDRGFPSRAILRMEGKATHPICTVGEGGVRRWPIIFSMRWEM